MAENDKPKKHVIDVQDGPLVEIDIDPDTVDFIIVRAREFDAKVPPVEPDPGSNPSDDKGVDILEDLPGDFTETELRDAIDSLSDDAAHDLVALYWVGRGDFTPDDFKAARGQSIEQRDRAGIATYLLGEPNLGDFLEDGLSQLGYFSTSDEVEKLPREDSDV